MTTCDICLDEKCEGRRTCNCETCKVKDECPKFAGLRPTIRITTKCTQRCGHCCFSCSPKRNDMMTIDTSKVIGQFLKSNKIKSANLMGGEFFCNPDWFEIFSNIMGGLSDHARIVTNSDWVINRRTSEKVIEFGKMFNVYFALTIDKWHTNKHVGRAQKLLDDNGIRYQMGDHESDSENSIDSAIVPIGESAFSFGFYASFGTYCRQEINKYCFMIDEKGIIYKCPFGVWNYDEVSNYLNGGFNLRFKECNSRFYKQFITNCKVCIRSYEYVKKKG